jgi:hypothetical protein
MLLFQRTIFEKHLLELNNKVIGHAYNKFIALFQQIDSTFQKYPTHQFHIEIYIKKLKNCYAQSFGDFISGLNKAIRNTLDIKLTQSGEIELLKVIDTKKMEVWELKTEIEEEINRIVYKLYDLNEEEIKTVESV